MQELWASSVIAAFDFARDICDAAYEATFLSIYGSPSMIRLGAPLACERTRKDPKELRFLPEVQAIRTLPDLLPTRAERQRAIEVVEFIAGAVEEMEPRTLHMVQRFHAALGLPGLALPAATQDPLLESATASDAA